MPSKLVMLSWNDSDDGPFFGHVDNSLPSNPVYPSTGPIYGGGHPSHGLPGGGHISTLPVFPFDPTLPSNELPGHPSTGPIMPGMKFIVKWLCGSGLILVPDNELPATPEPK